MYVYEICKGHLSTAVPGQEFLQMNKGAFKHNSIGGFLCVVKC